MYNSDYKYNAGLKELDFHLLKVHLNAITHPLLPSYGHCIYGHETVPYVTFEGF